MDRGEREKGKKVKGGQFDGGEKERVKRRVGQREGGVL